jgi:antitoxin (DNA-binding transcriptional repressor) of toxin-antitoxin stability system
MCKIGPPRPHFRRNHADSRVASAKMAIYTSEMDISITEFKQRCLEIVRSVEKTGRPVTIRRRGKVVAQLEPSPSTEMAGMKPWEQLRALGGQLSAKPGESVLRDEDFEALR